MVGYSDVRCANVVAVVGLRQLMAKALRIDVRTRFTARGFERRIDGDANDVIARRHCRLSIATIQNKVLPGERESISVGPTRGDALVARNADRATATEFSWTRRNATDGHRIRICVEHAETAFGRAPNLARAWVDQLIKCVVPEMEMIVARSELKESVVGFEVIVWIADEDVLVSGVRGHHCESHQSP